MNRIKRLTAIVMLLGVLSGATGCKLFKKDCHCPSFGQHTPTPEGCKKPA